MSTISGRDPVAVVAEADGSPEVTSSPAPLHSPPQPATDGQGINLRTGFSALDWTLHFTRTTVIIDGRLHELPWGQHFFPLELGRHQLQVSYRYLHLSRAGKASILVDVAENAVRP
jgi:hypothetical protein